MKLTKNLMKSCRLWAAIAVGCALPGLAQAQQPQPVTFRLDIAWRGYQLPFMVGVAKGIYEKHGLKVELRQGTGSSNTALAVASGADDFGFVDFSVVAKSRDKQIPVKAIGGVFMKNPYAVFTRPKDNVKTPKDLERLKLGMALTSSPEQVFPLFAKLANLDYDKIKANSAQITDISTRDPLFLEGKLDGTFGFAMNLAGFEAACKCKISILRMSDYGINVMANGLTTSDNLLKQKPDVARKFVAATREAIEYTMKNPEESLDLWHKVAKDSPRTREVNRQEWQLASGLLSTDATKAKKLPYLCMADEDWKATLAQLKSVNQVSAGLSPNDVYTNEFAGCGK
jgi:NitT/TauT family transport system substrate-binding protein